jgi:hypothetical protein
MGPRDTAGREKRPAPSSRFERQLGSRAIGEAATVDGGQCVEILGGRRMMCVAQCIGVDAGGTMRAMIAAIQRCSVSRQRTKPLSAAASSPCE